jgi:HK97 family phage prohead protease
MIVEGYAVRFNEPTVMYEYDGIQYSEVIEQNSLDESDLTDVPFKYNHSDNVMIMARTRNKTLELIKDSQGLFIRANLAQTTTGKDLYTLIKRGDIDKMSFAFTVEEDSYNRDTHTRSIRKIKKLWDVAAVDTPAYDTTSIYARSWAEAEAEAERKASEGAKLLELEKLKLQIQLGGQKNE